MYQLIGTIYTPPSAPIKDQVILGSLRRLVLYNTSLTSTPSALGTRTLQHVLIFWVDWCCTPGQPQTKKVHGVGKKKRKHNHLNRKDRIEDQAVLDPNLLMTTIRSSYRSRIWAQFKLNNGRIAYGSRNQQSIRYYQTPPSSAEDIYKDIPIPSHIAIGQGVCSKQRTSQKRAR
ncbi:uncharacterized protein EAE98_001926 [Botrytis deweyae]|uniref:Uncharacterized protein n=1 Tax=Botrytis deweyae TaxID=2478750 RepID=A0ABQ7IZ81_9HELO|nr:uncharacterized protein EAE98_001926 [Botrytis deweyae]KAF7937612.1 hypothetical protein EAE98_001926 [Botrytis deweyae]